METLSPAIRKALSKALKAVVLLISFWGLSLLVFGGFVFYSVFKKPEAPSLASSGMAPPEIPKLNYWTAPSETSLEADPDREQIRYGRDLIANTAVYFGPKGKIVSGATNGMNCQNCHLEAGTKVFGNNYASVASTYPKYRARSGGVEDIPKRVNDCFERSLNGRPLDTASREMKAITAYIRWLGKEVPKGNRAEGSGFPELAYLDRAADPIRGKAVYEQKCTVCHGKEGQGQLRPDGVAYLYPPLWGKHSYNSGAGLYRISNFARYVKANMPLGATFETPQLSDEDAWDVAAYVNSLEHPGLDLSQDWPRMEEKPFDHPFGPYADGFSESQHKLGPFKPILAEKKKQKNTTKPATG